MIIGVGVDIVKVERFAKGGCDNSRIFTAKEQEYIMVKGSGGTQSAAGIFAAKEAVAKALGTGFRGFWPVDVEILHDDLGKPYVVLHGAAQEAVAKLVPSIKIAISISHSDMDAIAFAVAEQ